MGVVYLCFPLLFTFIVFFSKRPSANVALTVCFVLALWASFVWSAVVSFKGDLWSRMMDDSDALCDRTLYYGVSISVIVLLSFVGLAFVGVVAGNIVVLAVGIRMRMAADRNRSADASAAHEDGHVDQLAGAVRAAHVPNPAADASLVNALAANQEGGTAASIPVVTSAEGAVNEEQGGASAGATAGGVIIHVFAEGQGPSTSAHALSAAVISDEATSGTDDGMGLGAAHNPSMPLPLASTAGAAGSDCGGNAAAPTWSGVSAVPVHEVDGGGTSTGSSNERSDSGVRNTERLD